MSGPGRAGGVVGFADDASRASLRGSLDDAFDDTSRFVDQLAPPAPLPRLTGVESPTRVLGSSELRVQGQVFDLSQVNPTGNANNCVSCSIAVDAILDGRLASALPSSKGVKPTEFLKLMGKTEFDGKMSTPEELMAHFESLGPGSRGIVVGQGTIEDASGAGRRFAHAFNAYNDDGSVYFLDGQIAHFAPVRSFDVFYFIVTGRGAP